MGKPKTDPQRNTRGRTLLGKYLDEHTQTELAKSLGIGQPSVSAWLAGVARPEPDLRESIELLTGIPAAAWYTPDELARIERVRASLTLPTAVGQ